MIEGPRAKIDLAAIEQNFNLACRAAPDSKVMAVLKADAYGHGAAQIASRLASADAFAVARLGEAIDLRKAGVNQPLVVLEGIFDVAGARLAATYDLDLVIHALYQLDLLVEGQCKLWLKLDTGMNRLGLTSDDLTRCLRALPEHRIRGVMSHLSDADDPKNPKNAEQLARLKAAAAPGGLSTCLGNSASIISGAANACEWIRPGLMLYGIDPVSENPSGLCPAMTFKAPVIAVNTVRAGATIGYGSTWRAPAEMTVAVLAVGYADGYPREIGPSTPVWLGGQEWVLGRVSMDLVVISASQEDPPSIGDEAELWGLNVSVDRVAASANTLPYVLLCGLGRRVQREFVG